VAQRQHHTGRWFEGDSKVQERWEEILLPLHHLLMLLMLLLVVVLVQEKDTVATCQLA